MDEPNSEDYTEHVQQPEDESAPCSSGSANEQTAEVTRDVLAGAEAAVLRKAIARLKAREAAAKTKSKVSDDDMDRCMQSLLAGSYALAAMLMDEDVQILEAAGAT